MTQPTHQLFYGALREALDGPARIEDVLAAMGSSELAPNIRESSNSSILPSSGGFSFPLGNNE